VRVHVCCRGRHLFDCNVGGHNLWTHNCVASATPAIAPSSDVQDWPGALRTVITDHEKMQKYLRGRAPRAPGSGAWPTPDAICPPTPGSGGRPTYVDVVVTDPTLASRLHATRLLPAVEAVDAAITAAVAAKEGHYRRAGFTTLGGPAGPGGGRYVTAAFAQGGRMSREFALLVRRWARERAGDDLEERGMSRTAAAFLRQAMCLLGTALHRAHAMRVHSAARDLAGLTPAGGRPGVGALPIGVRMALPPPAAGLADVDFSGLAGLEEFVGA
jgi:hypothetical protein